MNPIAVTAVLDRSRFKTTVGRRGLKLTHSTVLVVTAARARTEFSAIPAFAFDACCSPSFGSVT